LVFPSFILILILGLYCLLLICFILAWFSLPKYSVISSKSDIYVSIIVVVRDEYCNIGKLIQSIENQLYNKLFFELIVIDDSSSDGTLELLHQLQKDASFNFQVLPLSGSIKGRSSKKMGISQAIQIAKGQLIITTDGDCNFGPNWVSNYVNFYTQTGFRFISGPVTFESATFYDDLQIVEFASLIGTGAASIQLNKPNMCNGANLCFEKEAFLAVNGYEGFEDIPSGDDEFLMHKINKHYNHAIGFIKAKDSIVFTSAKPTIGSFLQQRKRWASKWDKYIDIRNSILAIFVFLVNISTLIGFVMVIFGVDKYSILSILALKLSLEWLFIGAVLVFMGYKNKLFLLPIVQFIYPIYIVFTALGSLSKSYTWKGRVY
jgi:glycosyltransferase involved in cell wall biosynthesis